MTLADLEAAGRAIRDAASLNVVEPSGNRFHFY
jgi:hypothetical protein